MQAEREGGWRQIGQSPESPDGSRDGLLVLLTWKEEREREREVAMAVNGLTNESERLGQESAKGRA